MLPRWGGLSMLAVFSLGTSISEIERSLISCTGEGRAEVSVASSIKRLACALVGTPTGNETASSAKCANNEAPKLMNRFADLREDINKYEDRTQE